MKKLKKVYIIIGVTIVIIGVIAYGIYALFFSMDNLPKGEFMHSVSSPDENYKINAFLCLGNATVGFSVRCEVVEIDTDKKRNIYWEYHRQSADIKWLDNTTVKINGHVLNVLTDSYDFRND